MRPQRSLVGTALVALILGGQVSARPAAAAPGGEEVRTPALHLERLAQREDKSPAGPEPDPGGLPGYRKEPPSAPAARPMMPETRGGPRLQGAPPADSSSSGSSSKSMEDKKKTEPK